MADPARTEPATPRRRQEARKRGQVARSTELTAALLLLAVILFFRYLGGDLLRALAAEARAWWGGMGPRDVSVEGVNAGGVALMARTLLTLTPLFLVAALVAIAANVSQIGVLFTASALAPKFDHLNPAQGFSRVFSQRTLVELLKAFVKIGVVGWVAYGAIRGSFAELTREAIQPVGAAFTTAVELSFRLGLRVALALLAIAILDYLYQRFEYERSLRMTRQEVRDEFRQTEGDPLVKARIRQLQREAARRRMISEVPKADVVITNPIHLAVAVRYDPGAQRAPRVVAKGARLLAERIKEIAREHRVPVYEDPPLAQALFPVAVGGELPPALYHAVAQVLAYVYHANHKHKEQAVLDDVLDRGVKGAAGLG